MTVQARAEAAWGFRLVQERGLFRFGKAEATCEEAFQPFREADAEPRALQRTIDFTLLSAAEVALLPHLVRPELSPLRIPLEEPIEVTSEDAMVAAARSDCGWTDLHPLGRALRPWDVMLFAGDMIKAELVGGDSSPAPETIPHLVTDIEAMYAASVAPRGRITAELGLVRLQGVLWTAKLASQVDPDGLADHLDAYLAVHPLVAD